MTGLRARTDEFRVAMMLLTRLPAGRLDGPPPGLARARWAFALVGVPVGLVGWACHASLLALGVSPLVAAILTLGALIATTGALHHDGLADFADGIGGGRDKDHCLKIMRDSRSGSYGVLALVLATLLWVAALSEIGRAASLPAFIAVGVVSRFAMAIALDVLPAARPDGLGARASHRAAARPGAAWPFGAVLSVMAALSLGWSGVGVVVAAAVTAAMVAYCAFRRIGGQTGDVLGAIQCLSETAGWVVLAVLSS